MTSDGSFFIILLNATFSDMCFYNKYSVFIFYIEFFFKEKWTDRKGLTNENLKLKNTRNSPEIDKKVVYWPK